MWRYPAGFAIAAVIFVVFFFDGRKIAEIKSTNSMFSICYITAPSQQVAESIARTLVTKRLAACVNIIPGVTSMYEWEGKLEKSEELLMIAKTRTHLVEDLIAEVKRNHPYDVPEIISTPLGPGLPEYLKWVATSTGTKDPAE